MNSGDFLHCWSCYIPLSCNLYGLAYTYCEYSNGLSGTYFDNYIYCNNGDILNSYSSTDQTGSYTINFISDGFTGFSCSFIYDSGVLLNESYQTDLLQTYSLSIYADGYGGCYSCRSALSGFYSFGYYQNAIKNIAPCSGSFEYIANQTIDDNLYYYYHLYDTPILAEGIYCNGVFCSGNYICAYNIPPYNSGDIVCEYDILLDLYSLAIGYGCIQDACIFSENNLCIASIGKCCICYDGSCFVDISTKPYSGECIFNYSGIDETGVSNITYVYNGLSGYITDKIYISGTTLCTGSIYLDLGIECIIPCCGIFICCGGLCVANGYYLINADGSRGVYCGGNAYQYGVNPSFNNQQTIYSNVCDFFKNVNLKCYDQELYFPFGYSIFTGVQSGIIDSRALSHVKFTQPAVYDFSAINCTYFLDFYASKITGNYCIDYASDGHGYYYEKCRIYCSGTDLVDYIGMCYTFCDIGCWSQIGYYSCYSDGTGGFYNSGYVSVINSGAMMWGRGHCVFLNESNAYAIDGYTRGYFLGDILNPSDYKITDFCNSGTLIYADSKFTYYSDGSGNYYTEPVLVTNFNNLKINIDFDKDTKNKYFNCITGLGGCYVINTCDTNKKPFYEFNFDNFSLICFDFVKNCCRLDFSKIENSFVYIKNNGTNNILIKTSNNNATENFSDNRIYYRYSFSGDSNYELKNSEGVFLYFQSDPAGNNYKINACYNYEFAYRFLNVHELNPSGNYPVCKYERLCLDPCLINLYEDIDNFTVDYYMRTGVPDHLPAFKLDTVVDRGAKLLINFSCSGITDKCIDICSTFGWNIICSTVAINNLKIQNDTNVEIYNITDISCINYELDINKDTNLNIIYNLSYCSKRCNMYFICPSFDPINAIIDLYNVDKYNNLRFCDNLYPNNSYLNYASTCNSDYLTTRIILCESENNIKYIKDINAFDYCFDNLFLQDVYGKCDFYNFERFQICSGMVHDFKLKSSNNYDDYFSGLNYVPDYCSFDFITGKSFINSICIVDSNYYELPNVNDCYSINLCLNKNSITSCCFSVKDSGSASEIFDIVYCDNKICNFNYCGLNFDYIPANYILVNNMRIDMPECCSRICFTCNGISVDFYYPINAVNAKMLNIVNNLNISDGYDYADVEYDFNFKNIVFKEKIYPDINNSINIEVYPLNDYVSGQNNVEYPNLNLNINTYKIIENNFNIYLNPFNEYSTQTDFCLYGFFKLLYSQINSGQASFLNSQNSSSCCISQTGIYIYKNQYYSDDAFYNCYINNTGIFSGIYQEDCNLFNYIPYSGYNTSYQNGCYSIVISNRLIQDSNIYTFSGKCTRDIYYYCFYNNLKNEYYLYHCGNTYVLNDFFEPCYKTTGDGLFVADAYINQQDIENDNSGFLNYTQVSGFSSSSAIDNLNSQQCALFILNLAKEACSFLCSCSTSCGTIQYSWNSIIECKLYTYKTDSDPISYKKYNDSGYSYIQLINSKICYSDNNLNSATFLCSGLLNNKQISNYYYGGSSGFVCDNYLKILNCNNHLYIDSYSFKNLTLSGNHCRDIYLEKVYNFTGILPITINSNTALSYLNCNILSECFTNYCYNTSFGKKNCMSGLFYYTYDLNTYNENNIENINLISPKYIAFNYICYLDNNSGICKVADAKNKNIYNGFLVNNAAQLNFDLKNSIKNNPYLYSTVYYICINSTSTI
jgi:hypothetical protein